MINLVITRFRTKREYISDDGSITTDINKAKMFESPFHLLNFHRKMVLDWGEDFPTQFGIGVVKIEKFSYEGGIEEFSYEVGQ